MALVAIALSPVLEYAVLVRPVTFLILVSVCFMIALGMISLLPGSRPARFYVIAWGAFLCGSVVFLLKNFGLVPHTFMTQHSWQVGALLEMILLSMTLSSRMNELKHQSRTDSLTLLGNRREFDAMLPIEFARAREQDIPLSLLVLDIDQFKLYNDLHGHAQGDEAVKAVAQALRKHARKPYIACRYGGDEFCAILPGTNEALGGGARRASAFRRASIHDGRRNRHGEHRLRVPVPQSFRKRRSAVRGRRCRAVLRQAAGPQLHRGIPRAPRRAGEPPAEPGKPRLN